MKDYVRWIKHKNYTSVCIHPNEIPNYAISSESWHVWTYTNAIYIQVEFSEPSSSLFYHNRRLTVQWKVNSVTATNE